MNELIGFLWNDIIVFLIVLTAVIFIHEFGHFIIARWCGVKVETFSIGFGPEIFGRTVKSGTRWRIGLLPLGGYVKMFGDADPSSTPDMKRDYSSEEKSLAFQFKNVWQRFAIVLAGPAANLIFGVIALSILLMVYGEMRTAPVVGEVQSGSAASDIGLRPGDRVIEAGGKEVHWFQDLKLIITMSTGEPISLAILRDGVRINLLAHPQMREMKDVFGNVQKVPALGIIASADATEWVKFGYGEAVGQAFNETVEIVANTLVGMGQIIVGKRSSDELGGPIRIAKGVGHASRLGFAAVIWYTIILSINLGLINLFPIPVLDGGRLLFYSVEAVLGRPLGAKVQDYSFRIGLFLVFALMIFAVRNDLVDARLWEHIKALIS